MPGMPDFPKATLSTNQTTWLLHIEAFLADESASRPRVLNLIIPSDRRAAPPHGRMRMGKTFLLEQLTARWLGTGRYHDLMYVTDYNCELCYSMRAISSALEGWGASDRMVSGCAYVKLVGTDDAPMERAVYGLSATNPKASRSQGTQVIVVDVKTGSPELIQYALMPMAVQGTRVVVLSETDWLTPMQGIVPPGWVLTSVMQRPLDDETETEMAQ